MYTYYSLQAAGLIFLRELQPTTFGPHFPAVNHGPTLKKKKKKKKIVYWMVIE